MINLEKLKSSLVAIGRDHVRFDDNGAIRRTSNIFSRWFNRRCAQFCESARVENKKVCAFFLELIKRDPRFADMSREAEAALNGTGRVESGAPLSGRKAAKVIDELFKKRNPERFRQIHRYGAALLDQRSDNFIRKVIDAGPKPLHGLPYTAKQIEAFTTEPRSNSNDAVWGAYFVADEYLRPLCAEVVNRLLNKYLHMKDPITADQLRSVTMRVLFEKEMESVYFGTDGIRNSVFNKTYDSIARELDALHLPVPSKEECMCQLRKDIAHASEERHNYDRAILPMAKVQPDTYVTSYVKRIKKNHKV